MIGGSKNNRDVKGKFNSAVIKGDLEQVKLYLAQMRLDPKDRKNSAINGIEWSLGPWVTPKHLQVAHYLLGLQDTHQWFGERSQPVDISLALSLDFYPNEKAERERKFHVICMKVWEHLTHLGLTHSPLASEMINHLLKIAQDCYFKEPAEFLAYKKVSLSSLWNAFTAIPGRISGYFFGTSQSPSSDAQDRLSPKSPALLELDSDYDSDNDPDYIPDSDDDSNDDNEEYSSELVNESENDSDYPSSPETDNENTDGSDCDDEINNELESHSDNSFALVSYQKCKKSADMKKSAKRVQPEKSLSIDNTDSDDEVRCKRQRM